MRRGDLYLNGERRERAVFERRARAISAELRKRGLRADDVAAIFMKNDLAMLEAIEACRYAGLYFATINWHAAFPEVDHILSDSGAKVMFAHQDLIEEWTPQSSALQVINEGLIETLAAQDTLFDGAAEPLRGIFAYTSGSTGRPKGIRRMAPGGGDRYQIFAMLARSFMKLEPGDRMHVSAPLYHSAPNTLAQMALAAGDADLFVASRFDAEEFLRDVSEFKITHAYIVPTMMVRLLKLPAEIRARYDVSSLRFTVSTGSPCPHDVKAAMIDWFGPIVHESYGASEIGFMTLISAEEAKEKPGSVGKILPGGEAKILDDEFRPMEAGEVGSIYVKLPMFGEFSYTNAEGDLSKQKHEGFATVGDMGHMDDDGYIFISDRKKDMIISGGANIFPAEIEAQLIQMEAVVDCAVFGAPDPEFGERVIAAVQCREGQTVRDEDILAYLETRLARFKLPRQIDFHDALPREDSGKIFKQKLRAPYWDAAGRKI